MEIGCLGRLHGANLILTAILEDTANPSWNDLSCNHRDYPRIKRLPQNSHKLIIMGCSQKMHICSEEESN